MKTVGLVMIVCSTLACSSGGDSSGMIDPGLTASFTPSATATSADLVRLTGGSVSGTGLTVRVSLAGPTTSADLYSFVFDLVLSDTAVASYEGPATVGSALSDAGCSAGLQVLAAQNGDRVLVGVTKLGVCAGNGVGAGETTVVSLGFRVHQEGVTSLTIEGPPSALDSGGSPIGSIAFDAAAATIAGL